MAYRYRTGNHWTTQTVILEGVQPLDERGRRSDDRPVVFVDSNAPEGLAAQIVAGLNGDRDEMADRIVELLREQYTETQDRTWLAAVAIALSAKAGTRAGITRTATGEDSEPS